MPLILIKRDEHLIYRPGLGTGYFRSLPVEALTALEQFMAVARSAMIAEQPLIVPPELDSLLVLLKQPILGDDAEFYYRRPPGNVRAQLLWEHTMNGIVNFWGFRFAMGQAALFGWKHVRDEEGVEVPFDPVLIPLLPGTIVNDIGVLVDDLAPDDFAKNYVGSLNGTSRSVN
jgi:hypothetical protein